MKYRYMLGYFFAVAMLIIAVSCTGDEPAPEDHENVNEVVDNGFLLRLSTDKNSYKSGETIYATAYVKNITSGSIGYTTHSGDVPPVSIYVDLSPYRHESMSTSKRLFEEDYQPSFIAESIGCYWLGSQQSITRNVIWDQSVSDFDDDFIQVPSGSYTLTAYFRAGECSSSASTEKHNVETALASAMAIGDGDLPARTIVPQTDCTNDMAVKLGPSAINTIADFLGKARTNNYYKWDSNGNVDFCLYEEPKTMTASVVIEIIGAPQIISASTAENIAMNIQEVHLWYYYHSGSHIAQQNNGKDYVLMANTGTHLPPDIIVDGWMKITSVEQFNEQLKYTPEYYTWLGDGIWTVRCSSQYGLEPRSIDVEIDSKSGDVLSISPSLKDQSPPSFPSPDMFKDVEKLGK